MRYMINWDFLEIEEVEDDVAGSYSDKMSAELMLMGAVREGAKPNAKAMRARRLDISRHVQ